MSVDELRRLLREHASLYLRGAVSRSEFAGWFRGELYGPLEQLTKDPSLSDLVYDLELLLSETEHGDWSEQEFRDRLSASLSIPNYALQITLRCRMLTPPLAHNLTSWRLARIPSTHPFVVPACCALSS